MNKKKWAAALLISVFAAGLALTGCGGNDAGESGPSGKVTVSGSSALLPLAKDAAQKFSSYRYGTGSQQGNRHQCEVPDQGTAPGYIYWQGY